MKRDFRLDTFRGLMLAEITLVHSNTALGAFANEFFGRVSVAAAFIFLSGLVAGAVYGKVSDKGVREIFSSATSRALYIHIYHIGAFLPLVLLVAFVPDANGYFKFSFADPAVTVWESLTKYLVLAYQPSLFDILPLYAVFVLFMPIALLAFRRGYAPIVFAISFVLWGLAQLGLGGDRVFGDSSFNPLAWQVVFFSGLYFGDTQIRRGFEVVKENEYLVALCLVICVLGFTLRWNILDWPAAFERGTVISSKSNYSIAYFVNFFAFAYLVFCLARRYPSLFVWRPFALLGQHSIQVFSFHIVALYLARPLMWRAKELVWSGGEALALLFVLSLFAPALLHRYVGRYRITFAVQKIDLFQRVAALCCAFSRNAVLVFRVSPAYGKSSLRHTK